MLWESAWRWRVSYIGQLLIAMVVVETYSVMYYLPVLLVAGMITGFVIGLVSNEMLKRLVNIQM